ncbi:hypothetical protein [Bradyrhizobium acaciae]|uniref:hypothetical protein n=1 Tax=Bradyrhizobium acaciae TaxID=2683706 RepID=UPI001E4FC10E|nr:hypothetical protein [Bradyrhizobium acaciae]MCC8979000.1 hypothetical protein [Bradyrhizobium acaciae]
MARPPLEDLVAWQQLRNTDEHNITIFLNGDGLWGGRLTEKAAGRFVTARRRYESEAKAKLAAFDGMIFLKDRRGWDG